MSDFSRFTPQLDRRSFLKTTGLVGAAALAGSFAPFSALAADGTVTIADIGVGDPGGDWSKFKAATGKDVNLVSIGNAPSAVVNQLLAGGGQKTFDLINIVGGMQKPLAEADLIEVIDTSKMPNFAKNTYIDTYLAEGSPGFDFIGYDGTLYGVPTVLQADSFGYLPDKTGEIDSYGAFFDPKFKGFVALEDNYTTTGQKTALYLKANKLVDIEDPGDMTPSELKSVIDFLIEKKKEGQFRLIWSGFEQGVNLLTSQEIYVMDCWEPMVFVARDKGVNVKYASPKEGYLLWAMAAYLVNNPDRSEEETDAAYALLDFMLGPWYGAKITGMRGYMTNPMAAEYAAAHPDEFSKEEAEKIAAIDARVKEKFAYGGTWQNRWPTHVEAYEEEWQRFKAA
ncbi:ABC transporter substrate-binding protein [Rhodobium gokarnense]|uniref:Spermidine/putrescine-binding protein n=1 Tax=Rhodobium gokarnense TaxID=364296 RepID=A0ABT3H6A0_9HYPH|nr:extracellular solute-binding protein [Rhodobium gokarnense]MCW2305917.1 spermidine/putrescine-binding protein [Rhodobium gokarnense]